MDPLILSRWQFAITTIYHFFFVPLTLGLSILIAIMETKYVTSGDETYKRMVKFWGKLFVINYAAGVVTGIVQEFHFGLNWPGYARFMGDIFGAPLAIEGLTSFFLESTFLGVWIFGWDRLSKSSHVVAAWLVAIGGNLSAFWILIANSFMQNPVGYSIENGRAVMSDFGALITNSNVLYQFPHVLAAGITTAGFIVLGFSALNILKNHKDPEIFHKSFRWASFYAILGAILVGLIGHAHGQWLGKVQPMKTSSVEAHWETDQPADFTAIAIIDEENQENPVALKVPKFLSFLLYNNFTGEVKGIKDLQKEAVAKYGPGDYIPNVTVVFWAFRVMVGLGVLMVGLAFLAISFGKTIGKKPWFLKMFLPAMAIPYMATTAGWIITEESRQPWIVYGLQKTSEAVSPTLSTGTVLFSLILFILIIGALTIVTGSLLHKYGSNEAGNNQQTY